MAILNNSNAISSGGYDINNSLRFRASASAYLSRTPASTGNRQTFTYSFWIKRGTLGTLQRFIAASDNATGDFIIAWTTSDTLEIYDNGPATVSLVTTQVFRDPSAWYHIVVAYDTTQATSTNRVKVYVNGSQVTAFGTAVYPTQNTNSYNNQASIPARIGIWPSGSQYLDGYLTEFNFINAQALTPSSFGETDTTTGSWKPKAYTGTYGTNGFYLKFSDIATTSGSNAGLGKDFSGNANYWTTNNISVTSGTTYDAMIDSPTLTSATVANYAVLNPLNQNASITLTEANLRVTSSGATNRNVFCTMAVPNTEKIYFEVNVVTGTSTGNYFAVGIAPSTIGLSTEIGRVSDSFSIESDQANLSQKYISGTGTSYGAGTNFATGNVLQVAIDQANGKIWFGKNNTWFDSGNPSAGTNPATSTLSTTEQYFIGTTFYIASGTPPVVAFNFGQRPFSYTPPTGFVRLNTYNLPDSTIKKGNSYMDATLYTGNGSTQTITNAAGFRPDLVWMKSRSNATDNELVDSVRGATKSLVSNSTAAEATDTNGLTAFNSNGFALGTDANYNGSARTFVGWQWQAGQGSTSSNTSGSITSTVSVNATAGFSIVTYTGNATSGATIGHGLGVAPKWIIVKNRGSSVDDWLHYHTSLGATKSIAFDTNAAITSSTRWNNTAPSSTVITLGTSAGVNASSNTYVAYCWAEIAGFSKFGSYTGNGSTDGTFVYLGFRPKFFMIKPDAAGQRWLIWDSSRNTYNLASSTLVPNTSAAEANQGDIDFLSNGVKLRSITGYTNDSGVTYIYAAFAENPFKNSLAR